MLVVVVDVLAGTVVVLVDATVVVATVVVTGVGPGLLPPQPAPAVATIAAPSTAYPQMRAALVRRRLDVDIADLAGERLISERRYCTRGSLSRHQLWERGGAAR